jgi:HSP20 family protein
LGKIINEIFKTTYRKGDFMRHMTPFNRRKNMMKEFMRNFFDEDFDFMDLLPSSVNSGLMRTDIKETDKEYIIESEMPGFTKDQIDISINDGYITIKAKREDQLNEEREGYIRKERSYGEVKRSFKLQNVKEDEIKAQYKNGLLKVTLPKIKEGKNSSKKIDIE